MYFETTVENAAGAAVVLKYNGIMLVVARNGVDPVLRARVNVLLVTVLAVLEVIIGNGPALLLLLP